MARHGRIAEEVFLGVRASRDSGMAYKQIANAFGICTATVGNICRAESYERYKNPKRKFEQEPSEANIYLFEFYCTQEEMKKIAQTVSEMGNCEVRTYEATNAFTIRNNGMTEEWL